ncbi:PRC-barrel domain-containing protein [Pararhizobium sp.]|uniref:PRC-barrel domain-containing protein n=1 Tax=Pararhizobium sp. TaxID=1977563 RepID=UPI002727F188|nr:PRC-barrel domain-containing protein [Pararhizobium sp.]MDO9415654.1 PRC-barrel domain-containing protein [Pararhizobium sp.]
MTKKLVTSVAVSALFAGMTVLAPVGFAQETTQPQTMETQPLTTTGEQPAGQEKVVPGTDAAETAPAAGAETTTDTAVATPDNAGGYLTEQGADQIAASTYVGQSVYNSADESVGSINDLILSKDGGIQAAVIGVGGFLGLGEKNVAVPFTNIAIQEVPNSDDLKLTTTETADTLKAAPEYKTKAQKVAEQNAATPVDNSTTSSTTGVAPATGMEQQPATTSE